MGLFDGPGLIANLIGLAQSPGASFIGNQIKNIIPQATGPMTYKPPGASAKMGSSGGTFKRVAPRRVDPEMPGGPQGEDPLMALWSQLLSELQSPVKAPTGIDTDDLMNQVRKAIDPIYDQRAQAAQGRTDRARGEVQDMYQLLADDYKKLAPEQIAQANAAQAQVEDLYGQLRSNLEGDYARVSKEQGDLFKSLGIESALPDVLAEQQAPVQDSLVAASENQAQQEQRYMDIGQMDASYYRQGSPNAIMTGNEISTDLLYQLQQYLNQNDAERTAGIQSGYMDQLGQAQSQLAQQQQNAQGETARRQEMLWQMLQGQLGGGKQAELNPDSFMGQLPQGMQQSVGDAFTRLQRSPEAVYGKVEDKRNPVPGTFVETTPEWYMAQADEMLRRGEIDPTTHQALQMYLQLYYQMGK